MTADNPWLRWALKLLLAYFLACMPDMWKLATLGPPASLASVAFVLATSLAAPPVYLVRLILGELAYLPALAPFAVVFGLALVVIVVTERRRKHARPQPRP